MPCHAVVGVLPTGCAGWTRLAVLNPVLGRIPRGGQWSSEWPYLIIVAMSEMNMSHGCSRSMGESGLTGMLLLRLVE